MFLKAQQFCMLKIVDEKLSGFLFVVILPFLLFFMSYYGFESSYAKLKSMEEPPDFMFSSVYAYRVIPNFLMMEVFAFVNFVVDNYLFSLKSFLLKNGTLFYHSIFLINAIFFVASSLVLNKILNFNSEFSNKKLRRIFHLLAVFFIVIVQYVPTNCDLISIFFYVTGAWLTLKYYHHRKNIDFLLLCLTILTSTFVRETSCLNIAFFAAIFFDFKNFKNTFYWKEIFFLIISFVLPYFLLKMMIPQSASFFEGIYFVKNFTSLYNLSGFLFGFLAFYFVFQLGNKEQQGILKKYLFFSLPYLGMITLVGLFWESRLFLPHILSGFVVVSHQFKNIQQHK
ncbi:hypothetical protein AB670_03823 [Chryseobacterium sp. MOF25P]|nr:hypothetical protein [Chryseobacterium sp. BGARF1]OBW39855.1 hypothetical protein AB670_03823 [Chryseobacterium sp. MOF25P]OBW46220.1 hypothetical protein AB671_01515 [Chryseobacterium sp. BGARF1]